MLRRSLLVLVLGMVACESEPTSAPVRTDSPAAPPREPPVVALEGDAPKAGGTATPASRVVPRPPSEAPPAAGVDVEHVCRLTDASVEIVAGVEIERIARGAGSRDTGTFREFIRLRCEQCVGERRSHTDCKEFRWSCHSTRLDLTGVDRGEPMRGQDVARWSSRPRADAAPLLREIDQFLEMVDEPGRYGYLDKDRARGLALRIKSVIPTLEGSPIQKFPARETRDRILLETPDGIVSVQDGTIRVLTWSPLGLGEAPCEGVHGPTGRAKGSVIRPR